MNFSSDPINTLENLIAKNKAKSFSIYLVLLIAILVSLALLPVIKVDISSQSRGMVRSTTDNVSLTSLVYGIEVKKVFSSSVNSSLSLVFYKEATNHAIYAKNNEFLECAICY